MSLKMSAKGLTNVRSLVNRDSFFVLTLTLVTLSVLLPHITNWWHGDDFYYLTAFEGKWLDVFKRIITASIEQEDRHYRPLINVIIALVFRTDNPILAHGLSMLIHLGTVLTLWLCFKLLVKDRLAAFAGALFFAVFPSNHTAIYWFTAVGDLLTTLFAALSTFFFLKHGQNPDRKYVFFSLMFFAISLLCKEMSLTLPAILLLVSIAVKKFDRQRGLILGLFTVAATFFLVRAAVLGHLLMGESDSHYFNLNPLQLIRSLAKYFYVLFSPSPIYVNQIYPVAYLISLPIVLLLGFTAYKALKEGQMTKTVISILGLFISIAPVAGTFSTWYIYLPSAVFAFLITSSLGRLSAASKIKYQITFGYIAILAYILFSWGNLYSKGGKFNRNILAAVSNIDEPQLALVGIPTSAWSGVPLVNNPEYFRRAMQHFYGQEKEFRIIASLMVDRLPKEVVLSEVAADTMTVNCRETRFNYIQQETVACDSIKIDYLDKKFDGKPTKAKVVINKPMPVYTLAD